MSSSSELDQWIADAVAIAPKLSTEQRVALAELLAPAREYLARKRAGALSHNDLVPQRHNHVRRSA